MLRQLGDDCEDGGGPPVDTLLEFLDSVRRRKAVALLVVVVDDVDLVDEVVVLRKFSRHLGCQFSVEIDFVLFKKLLLVNGN